MEVGTTEEPSRRMRHALIGAVIGIALAACGAAVGLPWDTDTPATITIDDAQRVLANSSDPVELEQALGASARRTRELVRAMIAQEGKGTKVANYATGHLDAIERMLRECR